MTADQARYARGAHRRSVLIEAAAELLLEHGFASLSHRAVATRAGLPLASTTYYFTSGDDLLDAALQHVIEAWTTKAVRVVAALPAHISAAQAVQASVSVIGADAPPQQLLLLYERYLEAGRHPRLRPVVAALNTTLCEMLRDILARAELPASEANTRLLLALADGVAVTALAEGAEPKAAVTAALTTLLSMS